MDSGYEAVLVDGNVATTNGINGTHTHEGVPEMKTRSKVAVGAGGDATDDDSAKPKIRLTRTTAAQNDKDGSDNEKKDKKKNLRSGGDSEEVTAGAKAVSKEPATAAANSATSGASSKGSAATAPTPSAASKKKAPERDDDSGINSRASSVSNDEIATPARMRTRSSRASEIASTSTPAYRRGSAARVPLSIYEYDAASFDDDLPISAASTSKSSGASSAQKRKAVVYVEEMEEDDDDEVDKGNANSAEPAAKRRAALLVSAGAGIVTSLLYPLRKLRSGIAAVRPYKAQSSAAVVAGAESAEQDIVDGAVATATANESTDTNTPANSETGAQSSDEPPSDDAANTCSLM
ncbi:hypothetical protein V9T40_006665 [Parthenolecanium corni]|uniref:Uncharacterized protein n=1 Tax=Parthenolecanium corni TaxID=536013 RepID=A0AAN9Y867_9HEMI